MWSHVINPETEFSIDETLDSFHSRNDPTSPQRYGVSHENLIQTVYYLYGGKIPAMKEESDARHTIFQS